MSPCPVHLSVCGVHIIVESDSAVVSNNIRFDFSAFVVTQCVTPLLRFSYVSFAMPADLLPCGPAVIHTQRYAVYDTGVIRYIEYTNGTQIRYDYSCDKGTVYALDPGAGYERLYLMILSRVGEILDRCHIHRVHALGFVVRQEAALLLLPSHGGKTTMALRLLEDDRIRLLSDEMPLLDLKGRAQPFPFRIGVEHGEAPENIVASSIRETGGGAWRKKTLIDVLHYDSRFARGAFSVGYVIIGKRLCSGSPRMIPAGRLTVLKYLFRDCLLGVGLPQVAELFVRTSPGDLFAKAGIAVSRLWASLRLTLFARGYEIHLSRDPLRNASLLVETLTAAGSRRR